MVEVSVYADSPIIVFAMSFYFYAANVNVIVALQTTMHE